MKSKTLLEGEIEKRFKDLDGIKPGTEEDKQKLESLTQLMDREIEMKKLKESKIGRWTRDGIAIGTSLLGAGIYIWGLVASTNFEREGTFTTSAGRKSVNKVLDLFK